MKLRVMCDRAGKIIAAHFMAERSDKSTPEPSSPVVEVEGVRRPTPSIIANVVPGTKEHRIHEVAVPRKWIGDPVKLAKGLSEHRVMAVGKNATLVSIKKRQLKRNVSKRNKSKRK